MDTHSKCALFLGMNSVKGSPTMECTVSIYLTFVPIKLQFLSFLMSATVSVILSTVISMFQHAQEAIESFSFVRGKLRCPMTFTWPG